MGGALSFDLTPMLQPKSSERLTSGKEWLCYGVIESIKFRFGGLHFSFD